MTTDLATLVSPIASLQAELAAARQKSSKAMASADFAKLTAAQKAAFAKLDAQLGQLLQAIADSFANQAEVARALDDLFAARDAVAAKQPTAPARLVSVMQTTEAVLGRTEFLDDAHLQRLGDFLLSLNFGAVEDAMEAGLGSAKALDRYERSRRALERARDSFALFTITALNALITTQAASLSASTAHLVAALDKIAEIKAAIDALTVVLGAVSKILGILLV